MNIYVVEGYDYESSWVSKIFDNEEAAKKYTEYMNLTNRFEYQFSYKETNVEKSFDLNFNEDEFFFNTYLDKEDNYSYIYTSSELNKESIEEDEDSYRITVKIKYSEYKDEGKRDKIIEERARKMLEEYLNEKNKNK